MPYELWDRASRNLYGDFPTLEEAYGEVRALIEDHGAAALNTFALAYEDEDGRTHCVVGGTELVRRAQHAKSQRQVNEPVDTTTAARAEPRG